MTMHIEIKRIYQYGEIIEGQLLIDACPGHFQKHLQYICDTLENGQSLLPPGQYRILILKCSFRCRKMPLIMVQDSAPPCSLCVRPEHVGMNRAPQCLADSHDAPAIPRKLYCPQITCGNGIHNRHDGSILVGKRGACGLLLHPKTTFDLLYERIRKSASRGHTITLNVVNA